MKEQIMVFSKEWFKKHNKTLCWFANAPIIKYWFRWLLRIHKDIPWNEKIDEIMPNAFTYGKKLVLVDYVKLKNGEEVFNCSKKLHRKLKNKGLLVKRLRYQQTTDFRTHDKFSKRLYFGLKPLWYLMHFLDWAMLDRCEELAKLSFGFSTLTFYPDAGTGNTTVDGAVYRSVGTADASWSDIRNGAGTGAEPTVSESPYFYMAGGPSGWQWLYRSIFLFDTSSLTSSATISSAVLSLYSYSKTDTLNILPNIDIYTSSPASNNNLQASDYSQIGTISQTGSPITYNNWGYRYNDFTFNATGRGNISKTGISKFGARNANYDVSGSTPSTSNGYSSIYGYFADQDGTTRDPKLVVTGTGGGFPSAPTVTTQSATNIAQTSCTGNGNIIETGGENATRRGFCYIKAVSESISVVKSPGTMGIVNRSSGDVNWINPENAKTSDDTYSTVTLNNQQSHYLKATNFGFNIPENATDIKCYAVIEAKTANGEQTIVAKQVKNGEILTLGLGKKINTTESTIEIDLAHVLTSSDVNNLNTGFVVYIDSDITDVVSIDSLKIKVEYNIPDRGTPTIEDNIVYDDGSFGTGTYSKSITGLTAGTSYRVRAYAVNSAGTSYGTTVDVTTLKAFKPRTMWF